MAVEKMDKYVALKNVDKVAGEGSKVLPTGVHVDINTADAYEDSLTAAEKVAEVETELMDKAKAVITENPETPAIKEKNIYNKLTLDESIDNFNMSLKDLSDESEEDDYLDYDMFNFVYGLVTDDWPRPKNPLGRPMRKFQHTDSDDYMKTNSPTGVSQVASDVDGNVVIYANNAADFNDVKAACDHYHITYKDVEPRKNKDSHWAYSLTINVPTTANGYPMMVEDFFEQYGLTMSEVIEDHKVGKGKSANWGNTYTKRAEKDRTETEKVVNDHAVEDVYLQFTRKAANSNDPLEGFIKDMFAELNRRGLKYSKKALEKRFLAYFEDDFED